MPTPISLQSMENLCSMNFSRPSWQPEAKRPMIVELTSNDPLGSILLSTGYDFFGTGSNACERVWLDDSGAETLGVYSDSTSRVAMTIKRNANWDGIWCITAAMPAPIYRELARDTGVHIYNEFNDAFYANRSYVTLHANQSGSRTIQWPQPVNVYDALTEQLLISETTAYTSGYDNGKTKIFRYEIAE